MMILILYILNVAGGLNNQQEETCERHETVPASKVLTNETPNQALNLSHKDFVRSERLKMPFAKAKLKHLENIAQGFSVDCNPDKSLETTKTRLDISLSDIAKNKTKAHQDSLNKLKLLEKRLNLKIYLSDQLQRLKSTPSKDIQDLSKDISLILADIKITEEELC